MGGSPLHVLLVEDNPGDVRLTREALKEGGITNHLMVVKDGVEAMSFLRKEGKYEGTLHPDLIILDWNLPRKNGREVLKEIKDNESFRRIPVIVLTSSESEKDIKTAYNNYANCYITKPIDHDDFADVIKAIQSFWLATAKLPPLGT